MWAGNVFDLKKRLRVSRALALEVQPSSNAPSLPKVELHGLRGPTVTHHFVHLSYREGKQAVLTSDLGMTMLTIP